MTPFATIALVVTDVQRRPMKYAVILLAALTLCVLARCRRCPDLAAHEWEAICPDKCDPRLDELARRLERARWN